MHEGIRNNGGCMTNGVSDRVLAVLKNQEIRFVIAYQELKIQFGCFISLEDFD